MCIFDLAFSSNRLSEFENPSQATFNNLTNVLLAGPVVLPVLPLAKFNFDMLVLQKDPYCILLLSVMPVDAAQKKIMKFC